MNESQEKVLNYLTGFTDLETVPVEVLRKLVEEEPYFPVAHYLLARRLKTENQSDFQRQVQKTALFFSNPLWLNYQLNADHYKPSYLRVEQERPASENIGDHSQAATIAEQDLEVGNNPAEEETFEEPATADTALIEAPVIVGVSEAQTETFTYQLDQNFEAVTHADIEETAGAAIADESAAQTDQQNTVTTYNTDTDTNQTSSTDQPEEEAAAITRDTDASTERFVERLDEPETTSVHSDIEETLTDANTPAAKTEIVEVEEEMAGVTHGLGETTEAFLKEAPPVTEEQLTEIHTEEAPFASELNATGAPRDSQKDVPGQDEHERMFLNIKAMLDATSDEANAETKEAYVPIDPYYTIDYFASQGIKLDLDQNPQDQLGKNLKKFTQWLKHMKKLGPEDAMDAIKGGETEEDIQQIADSSNTIKEVVTEAMAAVLEKQGKKDKAIELYNKLSFLNPDKRTYFADKIKNLNGI